MTTPNGCLTDERSKRRGKVHFDFALQGGGNAKRNILESGTVMPIHRHLASSETVVLLRGRICWLFYDDAGHETESVVLDANGDIRCINVEKARWHSLECMESGSVLLECKDGRYEALREEELLKV